MTASRGDRLQENTDYNEPATLSADTLSATLILHSDEEQRGAIASRSAIAHRRPLALVSLLPFLFTVSVTTTPLVLLDPSRELRSSGAASVWGLSRRRGKRISLREARLLALRILAETEERLQRERKAEFEFFISFDEDELPTTA